MELLSLSESRLNSWKSKQTQLSSRALIPQQLILDLPDSEHDDVSDALQLILDLPDSEHDDVSDALQLILDLPDSEHDDVSDALQLILDLPDSEHDDVSDALQLILGQWYNPRVGAAVVGLEEGVEVWAHLNNAKIYVRISDGHDMKMSSGASLNDLWTRSTLCIKVIHQGCFGLINELYLLKHL